MPDPGDDDELTSASEADPDIIKEAAEEAMKYLSQGAQQEIGEIGVVMSKYQADIDVQSFESQSLELVWSGPLSDPNSDVSQSDSASENRLKELSDKLDTILKKNAASEPSRLSNAMKWLGIGGMVIAGGAGLVFELISRFAHNQTGDGVPGLTDDDKQKFQAAVAAWGQVSDSQYWSNIYLFGQTNNATAADLIYFMQYTQQIFPLQTFYIWPHQSDKTNLSDSLYSAAQKGNNNPLIIVRQLEGGLKDSKGTVLARAMAASCGALALSELATPANTAAEVAS